MTALSDNHLTPSWAQYDSLETGRHQSTMNWLASFVVGSKQSLPVHNPERPLWHSRDSTIMRWNSFKRSLMRKLPSFDLLAAESPRGNGLTRPPPSAPTLTLPSAATTQFILLCGLWYTTSALSSNTGKAILTQFRYPVTLTFVQFGFVAGYCLLFMSPLIRFTRLRSPTKAIIMNTLPMGIFQVGGHITSSMAISRIPVSTVHTIKALSPLFTVAAYALLFRVSYSAKTYLSLVPLTLGVMLACSFDMSASDFMGLIIAFGSAIIFVTSNIFFKKIMPSGATTSVHQLDKLNLLFYSSGMAFLLMIPIWIFTDLPALLTAQADPTHVAHPAHGHSAPHSALYYLIANGTVHFAQNIVAFIILASTSPVTYSIASLIKRVVVICIAIVWFAQSVHPVQGFGICMTFLGLYMYNGAKEDVEKGETKMRRVEAARDLMLPSTKNEVFLSPAPSPEMPHSAPLTVPAELSLTSAYGRPRSHTTSRPPPPPASHPPPASSYSQTHAHPNLHIKITPPAHPKGDPIISPVDSYPSPPPSLDSPPSFEPNGWITNRRGMATGGVPVHGINANAESQMVAVAAQ